MALVCVVLAEYFARIDTMYTTKIQTAASSSVDCLSHQHWPRLAHGLSDCYLYINSNNSKMNICFLSVLWTFVSEIQITCSESYYNKRIILIEEVILILIGNLILLTEQARFYLNFYLNYSVFVALHEITLRKKRNNRFSLNAEIG